MPVEPDSTTIGAMGRTAVSRRIRATPHAVYAALLDGGAVARWKVPDGMSSVVHEWEPRVGGRFRVSLSYDDGARTGKSSEHTDTYHGRFLELVPDELVLETVEFETDDDELRGAMTIRTVLEAADGATRVLIDHRGIPEGVAEADNRLGTEMALAKLAALLEDEPDA
jgi:uncharacterized protein YndB with AHSA1/START domain